MSSVPTNFRGWVFEQFGAPGDVLRRRDDLTQQPLAPHEVRLRILSAAVNPIDGILMSPAGEQYLRKSPSPEAPFRVGFDAAGIVAEIGSEVTSHAVGDRVFAMTPFTHVGTFAEYHVFHADHVTPQPSKLSADEAASVPLVALTSYQGLVEHAKLERGQRVLILGGSSATGMAAVQIAKALGAYVYTTAGTRNLELVKSLGADRVIDYTCEKWLDIVGEHSLDVIYDCGMEPGSWNGDAQVALKATTGHFVTLLSIPEPVAPSHHGAQHHEIYCHPSSKDLAAVAEMVENGQLKTRIDTVFSFDEVPQAMQRQKTRRAVGKLVIRVASEETP